jgi:UDP-N-acetylglucosamine 4,6-dehydratase
MFNDKTILITGGSGSWGNELTRQLLASFSPKEIRIFSRGEVSQWVMKRKFNNNPKLKFIIGDVRDKERLRIALKSVDIVFHLAALKHVPVCEENPNEAVLTNIMGTQNLIDAAIENNVELVVDVSTDKAVDPLNLYGVTKACGERLSIAANNAFGRTRFVCIRGGNVLGTNGSVVPLFREQILRNNAITITDTRMTRFFLSLKEAIGLLFKAAEMGKGGEVFVMKMPAAKITDLAEVMIKELGNAKTRVDITGIRPGEKVHEVLVSRYEIGRIVEAEKYYIILPVIKIKALENQYGRLTTLTIPEFSSQNTRQLSKDEIRKMLQEEGWLSRKEAVDEGFLENLSNEEIRDYSKKWLS